MEQNIPVLFATAISLGIIHTLAGPDHYLPFVAMSKVKNWSTLKTINVVIICGLGHVLSSVVIGFLGIATGIAVSKIEIIEGFRGNVAAWLLLIFGITYTIWAIYRIFKHKHHHTHSHINSKKSMTFWMLFTIFIFGPCEPLIPLLMYPAAQHHYIYAALIALLFAVATIGTMIISVLFLLKGFSFVKMNVIEKYQHILAGSALTLCGAGIIFLGL